MIQNAKEVKKADQGQYQRYPLKSSPGDYRLRRKGNAQWLNQMAGDRTLKSSHRCSQGIQSRPIFNPGNPGIEKSWVFRCEIE